MDNNVIQYADEFIAKLKTTDEYILFNSQLQVINKFPSIKEELDAYRHENFLLQQSCEGDELYDKQDELLAKYEKLLEDSRVKSFLRAEVAFCRMIQQINEHISEEINFE